GIVAVGLGAMWVWLIKSGIAVELLKTTFGPLMDEALTAFNAIRSALAGGDFGAAAQVLWSTLKYWWTKGVGWLTEIWIEFKRAFLEIFLRLSGEAQKILSNVWAAFQSSIESGMDSLQDAQRESSSWLLRKAGEDGVGGGIARTLIGYDP